jgi:hypothetical protein
MNTSGVLRVLPGAVRCVLAVVAALTAGTGGASAQGCVNCGRSVPMFHGYGGYFECSDIRPAAAFAYQISAPEYTNTAAVDILCDTYSAFPRCSDPRWLNDGRIEVSTDWGNPGIHGCPLQDIGSQRVAIVVQGNDGRGVIVSISGANFDLDYSVDVAHKFDPATGLAKPLACSEVSRPQIRSRTIGADGRVTMDLHLMAPLVYTDCDPDSLGVTAGLNTCPDHFVAAPAVARLYTSVQRCDGAQDLRRWNWTPAGVTPDAAGNATVTVAPPATEQCALVGYTATIGGFESGAIVGFVKVQGLPCADRDADGWTQCDGDCDDSVPGIHPGADEACNLIDDNCNGAVDDVECPPRLVDLRIAFNSTDGQGSGVLNWTSSKEVQVAGFNVVMVDPNGRRTQINNEPVPCHECTTGLGHTYGYLVPKHKSGRNLYVEMLFSDGRVVPFGPAVKQ